MSTFLHDPDARLDYAVDWLAFLQLGETITTSAWDPIGEIGVEDGGIDDTKTKVWVSGGEAGRNYRAVNHIQTSLGRTADQTLTFWMRQS